MPTEAKAFFVVFWIEQGRASPCQVFTAASALPNSKDNQKSQPFLETSDTPTHIIHLTLILSGSRPWTLQDCRMESSGRFIFLKGKIWEVLFYCSNTDQDIFI